MERGLEEMLMRYIHTDYQRFQLPVYGKGEGKRRLNELNEILSIYYVEHIGNTFDITVINSFLTKKSSRK